VRWLSAWRCAMVERLALCDGWALGDVRWLGAWR